MIGFALFALPPLMLDRRLLRRLVVLYIVTIGGLSIWRFWNDFGTVIGGYRNFNVNQNAAAQQFYVCAALALFVMETRKKWLAVMVFGLLMMTTLARTATVVLLLTVGGYLLIGHRNRLPGLMTIVRAVAGLALTATIVGLAVQGFLPDELEDFLARFKKLADSGGFLRSRGSIWKKGLELSLQSPRTVLFGHGPAQISGLIGRGAHSSYITAVGSYGYVFLAASLLALTVWIHGFVRRRKMIILAISIPILLYGATDTILFSGVSFLWYLLAFLGMYLGFRGPFQGDNELVAEAADKNERRQCGRN